MTNGMDTNRSTDQEPRCYSRSVSQLKQVTKCGEAFAVSRGFRGPRPPKRPWVQTVAGRAFHEALMKWEQAFRVPDPIELFKEEWAAALEEAKQEQPDFDLWMLPPGTKYTKKAIDAVYNRFITKDVPNYIDRCKSADWKVYRFSDGTLALELGFTLDLNGVTVRGSIDRIQWWPDQKLLTVEDLKTGSPKEENDARQLGVYRYGALQHNIELKYGRYWFTKVDRPSDWVDLSRYTFDALAADYRKVDNIINQDLLLPNPGDQCNVCDVKPWCSAMGWLKPGESL